MSESRRSCRSRKTVDYSAFGTEEDNDDDFADPTPPPKKAKGSNKENKVKKKKEDEVPKMKSQEKDRGTRQSLEDKLFDRDLEAALKLSVESSAEINVAEVAVETHNSDKPAVSLITPSVESRILSVTENKQSLPSTAKLDDEIVVLPDDFTENPRKRRKAAAKPVKYDDGDDDNVEEEWKPEKEDKQDSGNEDDDDDDDDDEFDPDDSDSDYGSSKKKKGSKKAKPKAVTKKATPAKTKLKSMVTVTPVHQSKPTVKRTTPKSAPKSAPVTPSHHTPSRALSGALMKAWVPPARSGSATSSPLASLTVKSPSSGLRLGLSRNQKVKPLHPSVVS